MPRIRGSEDVYGSSVGRVGYVGARGADDLDLGGVPDLHTPTLALPAPGAPEPLNGYFRPGRPALKGVGDCGCGCGGMGGCGDGLGDLSEGERIGMGVGAIVALLFGTRAEGAIKMVSYGTAAYLAYRSFEGQ
jgi:hypothetical protein